MASKVKLVFPLSLLFFTIVELFLLKSNQFQIGIYVYIFYCLILFFIDKKYIISFFVFYLPLLPIIPTDYKIYGIFGPHEIIYGFSFLVLLSMVQGKIKLNKYQKLAIQFTYFLFFMNMYIILKDIGLGLEEDREKGGLYIFKNFLRFFLYYMSLVFLIKIIYQKGIFEFVFEGMKYSIVVLVLSMVFSKELILLGADIANKMLFLKNIDSNDRFLGFYGAGGDENSAGVFLVGFVGFILAMYERTGSIKDNIVFLGLAVYGVLLTGSRTCFIALALVVAIFLINSKSSKSKFIVFFALVIFYFLFSKQLDVVLNRFLAPSARKAIDSNEMGRMGKWILYIDWLITNPKNLIIGNLEKINYKYAPHNYLIYILYHVGIIPFIIFGKLWSNLLRKINTPKTRMSLKNVYYILPFLLVMLTVNSFGSSIYLWIYLPLGAYLIEEKKVSQAKKTSALPSV